MNLGKFFSHVAVAIVTAVLTLVGVHINTPGPKEAPAVVLTVTPTVSATPSK